MATVLLCDDELMNRKVASKILIKEGFHVLEAQNGKEALDVLQNSAVDLILMDLMMPIMDGFEATKIIKSDKELAAIPLIIISALSDKEAVIKGLEMGADEYLTKPFDLMDFRLRIKNAIKIGIYQNMIKRHKELLELEVQEKTKELQDRPYKKSFPLETALEIIQTASGTHFNPKVVELFFESLDEILEIQKRFHDV